MRIVTVFEILKLTQVEPLEVYHCRELAKDIVILVGPLMGMLEQKITDAAVGVGDWMRRVSQRVWQFFRPEE